MSNTNELNLGYDIFMKRQVSQDKSKFTPDDWIRYTTPLVIYALREPNQGMNAQSLYQKVILMGVLVGLGKTPQEAINQVRDWQNTGTSQILKGGISTVGGLGASGGTGTTGSIGGGGSQGTGLGTGGIVGSTGNGIGTTGGISTPGSGGTSADGSLGTSLGTNTALGGNINKSSRLDLD